MSIVAPEAGQHVPKIGHDASHRQCGKQDRSPQQPRQRQYDGRMGERERHRGNVERCGAPAFARLHRLVKLLDLRAQYESRSQPFDAALRLVVESGMFLDGAEVPALERELSVFLGNELETIACSSGATRPMFCSARRLSSGLSLCLSAENGLSAL